MKELRWQGKGHQQQTLGVDRLGSLRGLKSAYRWRTVRELRVSAQKRNALLAQAVEIWRQRLRHIVHFKRGPQIYYRGSHTGYWKEGNECGR